MVNDALAEAETRMKGAVRALEEDLSGIRTGRASPVLIERLPIEYYGTPTPLIQLATISVPEPRQLAIRPFDPAGLKDIERGILASDLGLTPNNDGKMIRLNIPPLTEQRRHELVRVVHNRSEEARVSVRNVRRDANDHLKKLLKDHAVAEDDERHAQADVQKLTDRYIRRRRSMRSRSTVAPDSSTTTRSRS